MSGRNKVERVCILMGMYNGAVDLPEQLNSLAAQTEPHWDLIVSDDGSTDGGPGVVQRFADRMAAAHRQVQLVAGPGQGFVANFLSLLARAPNDANWLALADQDDVWLPDRLERGKTALAALPQGHPALYCSATLITDARLENRRPSTRFTRPPGFHNALVQNIAAGNTILLNRAAAELTRAAVSEARTVPGLAAHDWWIYQLITGAGGTVIFDPEPTLLYRQHARNLIGTNDGWRARMSRIGLLFGGRFAGWNTANIAALRASGARLTPDNRALLDRFAAMRGKALIPRIRDFAALGLYRQSQLGQLALGLAVLLRRS